MLHCVVGLLHALVRGKKGKILQVVIFCLVILKAKKNLYFVFKENMLKLMVWVLFVSP